MSCIRLGCQRVRGCQSSNHSDKYSETTQFCLEHDEKKKQKIKNNEKKY